MSAQDQVQRLEALLARVHSRRDAPRDGAGHAPPPVVHTAAHVPVAAAQAKVPVPPPTPTPAPSPEVDVDVEVMTETTEIDLDAIEADELAAASLAEGAQGLTDEAPASSRRPIQLTQPDDTFDDATDATKSSHPAPPESGRQVALPATDFEGELSGVRPLVEPAEVTPAPPPPVMPPAPPPVAAAAMRTLVSPPQVPASPPQASAPPAPAELKGEIIRPPTPPAGPAAVFHGALPESKPQTFGELLETTLGL